MLTLVTLLVLFGGALTLAAMVEWLVDALDRRRLGRVAAQIRVTDAVHAALGAVVAPTVERHPGGPWTVRMGLEPHQLPLAGRLTEIARQSLGQGNRGVEVVFIPRAESPADHVRELARAA
jgi:hypothetical protein